MTTIPASTPDGGLPHPDRLLFSVRTPGEGLEPWSTDGTPGGTFLVRDLCPGPCDSDPRDFAPSYVSGFVVTFTAATPEGPRALWLSDGTAEGTLRLTPPGVTATSGLSGDLFTASDAEFGDEFWTSERTPETTRLWKDLGREQDSGSYPVPLGTAGGKLIFTAFTPAHGRRIWESDGTAAGTVRIPVPQPDPDPSRGLLGTTAGDRTFFLGPARGAQDNALWETDGTARGVVRLTLPAVKLITAPYAAGRRAVFFAADAEHGTELWASDGTPESTYLVTDLVPGSAPVEVDLNTLAVLNSQLIFRRLDDAPHVWTTDGTAEGTRRLIDAYPFLAPFENVYFANFAELPGKLFFLGAGEAFSPHPEVWVSDWTPAGTHPLGFPDADQAVVGLFPTASRLFITAVSTGADGAEHEGLWVTDGTQGGAIRLPVTVADESADGIRPTVYGERLAFTDEAGHLQVTDGTAAGTFALRNPAGQEIFVRGHAVSFHGKLVFAAAEYGDNGFGPCDVWDGSAPAAVPAAGVRCLGDFIPVGPRLFFTGYDPHLGAEPWMFEER